jgi:FdhE protein
MGISPHRLPGMGEEDDNKLELFTASDFDYIRVKCCESCKTYIKTVDLRKNGRAEPLVDELASAPLDHWSREHGLPSCKTICSQCEC